MGLVVLGPPFTSSVAVSLDRRMEEAVVGVLLATCSLTGAAVVVLLLEVGSVEVVVRVGVGPATPAVLPADVSVSVDVSVSTGTSVSADTSVTSGVEDEGVGSVLAVRAWSVGSLAVESSPGGSDVSTAASATGGVSLPVVETLSVAVDSIAADSMARGGGVSVVVSRSSSAATSESDWLNEYAPPAIMRRLKTSTQSAIVAFFR